MKTVTKTIVRTYHYFDEEERKSIKSQMKELRITVRYIARKLYRSQNYVYGLLSGKIRIENDIIKTLESLGLKIGVEI